MTASDTITLHCPAKVNLALSVGDVNAEGMHPLASWMVALDFGDRLTVTRVTQGSRFDLAYDPAAPRPGAIDWPLEKDLAFRAHQLMQQHVGRALPVQARLAKMIPTGAGLGGGSSDAAAMMVALDQLFDLHCDPDTLIALSTQLGSDIGFLIATWRGQPSAIATGLGEQLDPQPLREPVHLVLIFPPCACPTGQVYRALDAQRAAAAGSHPPQVQRVRELARQGAALAPDAPFNDLAAPACAVQPQLAEVLQSLRRLAACPVHITGSGAAMFILARDADHARTLAEQITSQSLWPAVPARTLDGPSEK